MLAKSSKRVVGKVLSEQALNSNLHSWAQIQGVYSAIPRPRRPSEGNTIIWGELLHHLRAVTAAESWSLISDKERSMAALNGAPDDEGWNRRSILLLAKDFRVWYE